MEHSMSHLERKIAVIAGGSSGIGLVMAKRFVREGLRGGPMLPTAEFCL
jgi:NADP-dependent 3-hydroxy acid dehydrogenase YdfG